MSIKILAPDVCLPKLRPAKSSSGLPTRPRSCWKIAWTRGATDIQVEIREGGQRLLRVSDNGHGIPQAEVLFAFERHATSKLQRAEELNSIATFGFSRRGALQHRRGQPDHDDNPSCRRGDRHPTPA